MSSLLQDFIAANLPPPPTPPEEIERRQKIAEEFERLEREEQAGESIKHIIRSWAYAATRD